MALLVLGVFLLLFLLLLFLEGLAGFLAVRSVANLFRRQWRPSLRAAGGAALSFVVKLLATVNARSTFVDDALRTALQVDTALIATGDSDDIRRPAAPFPRVGILAL
jgi:hypothetical protein